MAMLFAYISIGGFSSGGSSLLSSEAVSIASCFIDSLAAVGRAGISSFSLNFEMSLLSLSRWETVL